MIILLSSTSQRKSKRLSLLDGDGPIRKFSIEYEQISLYLGLDNTTLSWFMRNENDLARRFDLRVNWSAPTLHFAVAKYFAERYALLKLLSIILHARVWVVFFFSVGYSACGNIHKGRAGALVCWPIASSTPVWCLTNPLDSSHRPFSPVISLFSKRDSVASVHLAVSGSFSSCDRVFLW